MEPSVIRIPTNGATTASASASATALLLPVHNNPCRCARLLQAGSQKGSRPAPERAPAPRKFVSISRLQALHHTHLTPLTFPFRPPTTNLSGLC